ncbi:hypothetical protein HPQ64_01190 [Rhizobiales bacterium]|uniref:isoprenylcysteine carboxyl methyltransferase family protein n=1 Tax=Hongsoonwoonella zoysiae TaxID=2821844 RepID=UPI00155F9C75|nr:isoprenylcysteine carboxylmethyltransferase family protein [Hongsoonwoonella zoysiae]NRG16298.1 hypothetical protein [Hongsoonwoonella zoysiae]
MTAAAALLAFVTLQRLGELLLARRNTKRLIERGGVEVSPGHYPLIVALHAAWLAGLWILAWQAEVRVFWLAVFVLLQLLRIWIIATLGERWTTRIVIMPGAPLIAAGPYRFLKHPNYVVVALEIAVLPLTFGLAAYALVFSVLNAGVLFIRIRAEEAALNNAGTRP